MHFNTNHTVLIADVSCQGGMPGAERLRDNDHLSSLLTKQASKGAPVAAICAAPAVVLESKGYLKGKIATCHPAFVDQLSDQS